MLMSTTYEQTLNYNPNDPSQVIREVYAGGRGFQSYYYNRVPSAGTLSGLGSFSSLPQWGQIGIVTAIAAVIGYFGYPYAKPALKKIGLGGGRRRR